MNASAIAAACAARKPIGIRGQAPSDHPGFAAWLAARGITSISPNPDSIVKALTVVAEAEQSPATDVPAGRDGINPGRD